MATKMRSSSARTWFSIVSEPVHSSDDTDIGNVYAISKNFIVIKRGLINVHYYYLPISQIEGWDGKVLWLTITEEQVKNNYERDITPDPLNYYMVEYPGYGMQVPLPLIPPKEPKYEEKMNEPPSGDVPRVYSCPLCNEVYQSEDELGNHVAADHVAAVSH
jgi:hypothetical protein